MPDTDQGEITILDPSLQERISPDIPSLLAYHRTAIRLYIVMERIVTKINMPACTTSSALNKLSRDMGARRYDETAPHSPGCEADHRGANFSIELSRELYIISHPWTESDRSVLDKYQYSDIPLPSRAIEEDSMYHLHLARIRSLSAFCRLLIASHLFSIVSFSTSHGVAANN